MADVYQRVGREGSSPYFYKITNNKQWLYFVGAKHTYDPDNFQIPVILKLWKEFSHKTNDKNCIALVEGGKPPVPRSLDEGIKKYNGSGLLVYLAEKEDIESISPEPGWINEIEELLKEFTKEEIMYHDFARTMAQWNRLKEKPDHKDYVKHYMDRNKKKLGWKDFDFSFDNFVRIHDENHDHKFDKENFDCFNKDSSPFHSPLSAASNKIRDTFMVEKIIKLWEEGKNIFTIYGSGHAITQEPALKKLLKEK